MVTIKEVSGERVSPERYAAMTRIMMALCGARLGKRRERPSPIPAPTARVGANKPPGMLLRADKSVARNLAGP